MKAWIKYLLPTVIVVALFLNSSKLQAVIYKCLYHHDNGKAGRSGDKMLVLKTYLSAYQRELNVIRSREGDIRKQDELLDTEYAHVKADSSNTVEAGMAISFREGINMTLKERNRVQLTHVKQEVVELHSKYSYLIKDMGYDWREFEQLMCREDRFDHKDTFCVWCR